MDDFLESRIIKGQPNQKELEMFDALSVSGYVAYFSKRVSISQFVKILTQKVEKKNYDITKKIFESIELFQDMSEKKSDMFQQDIDEIIAKLKNAAGLPDNSELPKDKSSKNILEIGVLIVIFVFQKMEIENVAEITNIILKGDVNVWLIKEILDEIVNLGKERLNSLQPLDNLDENEKEIFKLIEERGNDIYEAYKE